MPDYGSRSDNLVFDGNVLAKLIKYVTGTDVKLSNADFPSLRTSADMRANGSKEVYVTIEGKQWIATYLSTNLSGEPIITLWLANSNNNEVKKSKYNTYYADAVKYQIIASRAIVRQQ